MAGEWYKAAKPTAFLGLPRAELDAALGPAALAEIGGVLDSHTTNEPLHVGLRDRGYTDPAATPRVLVLELEAVQVDAGLNEIPRATCVLAAGRDAELLAGGAAARLTPAVGYYLERVLNQYVPARVYAALTQTDQTATPAGEGDADAFTGEWVVLFDGFAVGPTRRGTPADYKLVLHLAHFTASLTFSSSLTPSVAAGTEVPYAWNTLLFAGGAAPSGYLWATPFGMTATTMAGGLGLYTDFWGYRVPGTGDALDANGLKGFLHILAEQDLFDRFMFSRADLGATACPDIAFARKNDKALAALARIEPFWPDAIALGAVAGGAAAAAASAQYKTEWDVVRAAVERVRAGRRAAGSTLAVDREDVIANTDGAVPTYLASSYRAVGYRYGVPVTFYLNEAALGPFSSQYGFAHDVAAATFADLAPASFWELLANRYATRYQVALAPMADRAVVVPFQPLLAKSWQTIHASEIEAWDDDAQVPVPVRGVVLVSHRRSDAGYVVAGGNPAASAEAAFAADAGFDSCQDGVFVYRSMPPWLVHAYRNPAPYAAAAFAAGVRASATVPWSTVPFAAGNPGRVALQVVPAALTGNLALAALGLNPADPAAAPDIHRSTANRLAKAYYQQERTRPKTVYVSGRFRYDVGPGSVVTLELPSDRYARTALGGARDSVLTGIVLRVTLTLDQERQHAATAFQIGFVRSEGEAAAGSVLYADSHPYWSTACYGVPWSDSVGVRNKLGDRADINY